MNVGDPITDVLGRVRPVARVYEAGEWDCPFCGYGTDPAKPCRGRAGGYASDCGPTAHCQNPACFANVHYPVERAREDLRAAEARADEERRRQRDREASARYREEARVAQEERIAAVRAEAQKRGACVRCALDGAPFRVKFIKHRKPCPRLAA